MKSRVDVTSRGSNVREAGAVAVEFALILPLFLVLVLGIAEYGRAFNIQVSLSEAARQASRYAAIHCKAPYNAACDNAARDAGIEAAPSVALARANVGVAYPSSNVCPVDRNVTVTINYTTPWMTGFPALVPGMPATLGIKGVGVMQCGG
ncbi:UNVERIFIED_ORG: Flp pilus assembly protein TadG [Arthrobacter sp. UYEF2]